MKSRRIIVALTLLTCLTMVSWIWDRDVASTIIHDIPSISDEIDMDGLLQSKAGQMPVSSRNSTRPRVSILLQSMPGSLPFSMAKTWSWDSICPHNK